MRQKKGKDRSSFILGIVILLFSALSGCATSKQVKLGDQFSKEQRWEEAYETYAEALKKDPLDQNLKQKMDDAKEKAAAVHAARASDLLEQNNVLVALEEVKRALSLDPAKKENQELLGKILRKKQATDDFLLGQKLMKAERYGEAAELFERALQLDPNLPSGAAMLAQAVKKDRSVGQEVDELSLKSRQPITLKFQNARLKEVFDLLAKTAGINILFDKDVRDDPITIFVKEASFKEALNLIFATNNLFMKKISDETILIIPKTKQKVDQYQDLVIRTFYISNMKAKEMVNLLRTMLETRRVFVNDELNTIVIRDTPEKVKLAEKIIDANDRKVAEMMFEVEILEMNRSKALKYGWSFSQYQIGAGVGSAATSAAGSIPGRLSLQDLRNINDSTIFFVLPSILIDFFKQQSDAQTLANPRIRVIDNKTAKINIGDRVPILLSTTASIPTSAIGGGQTTTTSIEFKDVGIKLSIEPDIHLSDDVTLKVTLEVTSLGDLVDLGNGQKQFRFGNRSTETTLNVRDSETVVISGLIRDDDRTTTTKVPGLGDIPILGKLFSSVDKSKGKTDIVMTITPHIIKNIETPDKILQSFWSGTEETYSTKPLFAEFPTVGEVRQPREGQPPGTPPAGGPAAPAQPSDSKPAPLVPQPESRETSLLSVSPREATTTAGGDVRLEVRVDNVSQLSSANLSLSFDPTVLKLKGVTEGSFMKGDGR
ncbi:MAG TPA: tetratricopeptide repeat protein, partial [Candidatus Manganitrophaceae bacterium]|nr:tetratricopeptide repeat protein [Candidatus Manganitrophaceae bacterium]